MNSKVYVFDPTTSDKLSSVRGIGRYLQILKENFPEWTYVNNEAMKSSFAKASKDKQFNNEVIFINPFFNFLQPPLTLTRIAKKQIAVIHDLIPLKYPSHFPVGIKGSIYILLNKLALKNYDLIITDSEASKRDIINILKVKSEKIKIIYPCLPKSFLELKIDNLDLNENLKLKIKNSFCLYVGDATWNKNLVNLAKAIKITNTNCVFVGKVFNTSSISHPWNKELNEFKQLVKEDKRFIFPGFVADSDLIKLYQQASMNILPSRDEGFGFSYVESSQFGCPSLLSDISVLKEISDEKAIFFNPNDPQEIANKINEINSNINLRNKIGVDAKKRSEFFGAEKFKREFLKLI